jgi:hypothetical protein
MGEACILCLNGFKVSIRNCKQFLDKMFGTQKTCWLDDDYIVHHVGYVYSLLYLHTTDFEVKKLIR